MTVLGRYLELSERTRYRNVAKTCFLSILILFIDRTRAQWASTPHLRVVDNSANRLGKSGSTSVFFSELGVDIVPDVR